MKPVKDLEGAYLDAAVAEEVFGAKWWEFDRVCINGAWRKKKTWLRGESPDPANPPAGAYEGQTPTPYSTRIAAAWEVVEEMTDNGWVFDLNMGQSDYGMVFFSFAEGVSAHAGGQVEEAICRAALQAVRKVERYANTG